MLGIIKAAGKAASTRNGGAGRAARAGKLKIVENTAKILVICVLRRGLEYDYAAAYYFHGDRNGFADIVFTRSAARRDGRPAQFWRRIARELRIP